MVLENEKNLTKEYKIKFHANLLLSVFDGENGAKLINAIAKSEELDIFRTKLV